MACLDYPIVKCSVCKRKTQDGYDLVKGKVVCDECKEKSKEE